MPSVSKKQHNFMEMIAHSPKMAKKAGVPQSVGKDFVAADKGKTFKGGGMAKKEMHSEKSEMKMDVAQDKKMIKKAVGMHDKQQHGGKKTNLTKLAKGGSFRSSADGIASKGKTKAKQITMCGGGMYKGKK
jgi:hypothetical protein